MKKVRKTASSERKQWKISEHWWQWENCLSFNVKAWDQKQSTISESNQRSISNNKELSQSLSGS